jgi:hypothetical protein
VIQVIRAQTRRAQLPGISIQWPDRSYRLGTDEFAEAENYRGICEIVRRRQILPQKILRQLEAIPNYAIRTHRENARRTLICSFGNSLVVTTLDFNIYPLLA